MQVDKMKEALLCDKGENGKVRCFLCAHRCLIGEDLTGRCKVRQNVGGKLYSLNYDKVCAASADPIEKKPLFHFLPGSSSFSISCPGCNFQCDFCQNWQISQQGVEGMLEGNCYRPDDIVEAAVKSNCSSIAYTYTEPTIFMELAADCGKIAKSRGIGNVFVSNGYMTAETVDFVSGWLDAINIDLKSFNDDFYRKFCKGRLEPVLETIVNIANNTDIWLELTTLIIPGDNDSDDELRQIADFIANKAGSDVPWHVSRFYPQYKLEGKGPTAQKTLERAVDIGKEAGLKHIYVGNMRGIGGESTYCPSCKEVAVERSGYRVSGQRLADGRCQNCGQVIAGVWG